MKVLAVNPILNVSDIAATISWFAKLGWTVGFEWHDDPTDPNSPVGFASVKSGNHEIFLCQGGQGGRGKGSNTATFGPNGDETSDKGVWMSIWVDDLDAVHDRCVNADLEITHPPTTHPWGAREMHVRHPDGHVFRISTSSKADTSRGDEMADTVKYVAVEVAGKPSRSKLLHRLDCFHLRDVDWPEPALREATDKELRTRHRCKTCLAQDEREAGR